MWLMNHSICLLSFFVVWMTGVIPYEILALLSYLIVILHLYYLHQPWLSHFFGHLHLKTSSDQLSLVHHLNSQVLLHVRSVHLTLRSWRRFARKLDRAPSEMEVTEPTAVSNALPPLTKTPIAQLSPALDKLQERYIDAAVTLVWPYSSSTKCISLLLSEPDFRLRRSNGQVKAAFHGRVAERIAESQAGIGDTVRLSLQGVEFVASDTTTRTPGRFVAWDIHFENAVSIEVYRARKVHSGG